MKKQLDSTQPDRSAILAILQDLYQEQISAHDLEVLSAQILPYVERSRTQDVPLKETVEKIARNYLRDGARVHHLLEHEQSAAWQDVLEQIVAFATRHALFPRDTEAIGCPDLDAYADIQRNLRTYNFEGSLDHWIIVTVVNRLRRYWRDRKSLSAGGPGFKRKAEREGGGEGAQEPGSVTPLSLDQINESNCTLLGAQEAGSTSVARDVEETELRRVIVEQVEALAERKRDDLLPLIWYAVVEQGWRLREVADIFGLTISQVHRRLEQTRLHLRQSPTVRQWLSNGE